MTDASPRPMLIDAPHLHVDREQNIHLVRWPNEPDRVEHAVRQAAEALDYHLALLDGREPRTETEVLGALEEWLFAHASQHKGLVILLREPEPFMRVDYLEFGLLFQALATWSKALRERGTPCSVVVGPLPEDYRYEYVLSCFTAARQFCEQCWTLDPLALQDPEQDF